MDGLLIVSIAGNLQSPRWLFQAVALLNGSALAFGGLSVAKGGVLNSTELYHPSNASDRQGGWTRAADMNTPRQDFAAVLLSDGSVLAAGGFMASAEVYNPTKVSPWLSPKASPFQAASHTPLRQGCGPTCGPVLPSLHCLGSEAVRLGLGVYLGGAPHRCNKLAHLE